LRATSQGHACIWGLAGPGVAGVTNQQSPIREFVWETFSTSTCVRWTSVQVGAFVPAFLSCLGGRPIWTALVGVVPLQARPSCVFSPPSRGRRDGSVARERFLCAVDALRPALRRWYHFQESTRKPQGASVSFLSNVSRRDWT